jgi:hypothetical protein
MSVDLAAVERFVLDARACSLPRQRLRTPPGSARTLAVHGRIASP